MADRAGREAASHLLTEERGQALLDLAARLRALALRAGRTVGTAESCTGGLVGHVITSIPGSSHHYVGGVVSYSDELKRDLLGVPAEMLARHGAVSAQVAVAMAEGLRSRLGCDFAVAVTGVAGPDGGTDAKPVGLTYVAVAGPDGHRVERHVWTADRAGNKELSAAGALRLLLEVLEATGR